MSPYTSLSDHCNSIPSSRSVIHSEPSLNILVDRIDRSEQIIYKLNYMYVFYVFFQNPKTWLFTFFWVVAHVFPNSASHQSPAWLCHLHAMQHLTPCRHAVPSLSSLVCPNDDSVQCTSPDEAIQARVSVRLHTNAPCVVHLLILLS